MTYTRFILIILDSVGIGAMPVADRFGDAGSDTLGNILARMPVILPNLVRLGLANIRRFPRLAPVSAPAGAYGMAALASTMKNIARSVWPNQSSARGSQQMLGSACRPITIGPKVVCTRRLRPSSKPSGIPIRIDRP